MSRRVRAALTGVTSAVSARTTPREIVDATMPLLLEVLRAWHSTLPPDASGTWRRGAVYIRESTLYSGVGNSPEMQLRNTLVLLATKHVYVPEKGIFFEVASGATLAKRHEFQRLFEEALAGGFEVVGVFSPDRLFRNQTDATRIRREFREQGIELEYFGKFEGDPKDAAYYQLNAIVDMQSQVHAHMASQYVGRHFEALSRSGRPVGKNPEVYEPSKWAPTFMGRPGSITGWDLVEPLASVIKEGCRRFLDGATLAEVATWSATTAVAGRTLAGHPTDSVWWRQTLTNPKYAGLQHPTVWPGFQPTRKERREAWDEAQSELVPCILPTLWDRDTYERILTTLKARWHAPKKRITYQDYLLSGIAYHEVCGHILAVSRSRKPNGHYWVGCNERSVFGRAGGHLRADVAEQEVDDLFSGIRVDDADLIAAIEAELGRRIESAAASVVTFRPNPEIAALRAAIASLEHVSSDVSTAREQLIRQVAQLSALDDVHREILSQPVVEFREAMRELGDWASVWREADTTKKNELLRKAEVRVTLNRLPGERRKPAHVREITSGNPVFSLALVAGLSGFNSTYADQRGLWSGNLEIEIVLGDNLPIAVGCLGLAPGSRSLVVSLPKGRGVPAPPGRDGVWWTTAEAATALGCSASNVRNLVQRGRLAGTIVNDGSLHNLLISDSDLNEYLTSSSRPPPRLYPGVASHAMIEWLKAALKACPIGREALAERAGIGRATLWSVAVGRGCTSQGVAIRLARALLDLTADSIGEQVLAAEIESSMSHRARERLQVAA